MKAITDAVLFDGLDQQTMMHASHITQMRDELRGAVQELKTVLENGHSEHLQVEDECDDLPENAADEHAGLGFR